MGGAETLSGLIAQRDPDAAAGFFDAHSRSVRRYCEVVAADERLDEATLAAFVDLLGRITAAPHAADVEDLLRRATRGAAASRAEVADARGRECLAMPDLLAARLSGELERDQTMMDEHRERCPVCQRTEGLFATAEDGWPQPADREPPAQVRVAWLALMAERSARSPARPAERDAPPVPGEPIRTGRRRGGLIGAARRLAARGPRDQ